MSRIAGVFFDLDGTLVDTAPEIADAVNDTLAYFDWPAVSQTLVDGWIGHGTQALLVVPLALLVRTPFVLVVNPGLGVT